MLFMKKDTRRYVKDLAYFSTIGLSVALATFIGLGIGIYLDRLWQTTPWLTLAGLLLGIAAGYKNIAMAIKKIRDL